MIEANRIDDHKFGQIIFVRNVVSVPGDHIKRGMRLCGHKEGALKFRHNLIGMR